MVTRSVLGGAAMALLVGGALLGAGACDDAEPATAGSASSSSSSSASSASSSSSSSGGSIDSGVDGAPDAPSLPAVAPPLFTTLPKGGADQHFTTSPVRVTITTATEGADLFFTLDGSTPTPTSERYTQPFDVSTDPTTIRALARKVGLADSYGTFVVDFDCPPASISPPSFNVLGGSYPNSVTVAISTPPGESTICFTVDGADPTCNLGVCGAGASTYVGAQIFISKTATTVRANACRAHSACGAMSTSVVQQTYTLKAAAVVATPAPGAGFTGATPVALTTTTMNGEIHYTTDGSTPTCTTAATATNTANLTLTPPTTVRAMVCKADFEPSAVSELTYGN